jgi:peptide/nickel transport system permease protein
MKKQNVLKPQHWLGFLLAIAFILVATYAPQISEEGKKTPGSFKQIGRATDFKPHAPDEKAILGTAPQQFDIFHSIIWGTADAIKFSMSVVVIAALIGMLIGILSAYAGGFFNSLLMRMTDAFLTIPLVVGVVFIQQLVMVSISALTEGFSYQMWEIGRMPEIGTNALIEFFTKTDPILFAFIALSWMPYARLMNTIILEIKENDFIMATRALGAGPLRVIFRHLLPNAYRSMLIMASRDLGNIVILQATITFLGLGGNSTWGELLAMGRDWVIGPGGRMFDYWWVYLPVTLVVIVFGITWNLVGEGLQHFFRLERE